MAKNEISFEDVAPRLWDGRYSRPVGKESAYHVSAAGKIQVKWHDNGILNVCPVKENAHIKGLAKAINRIKRQKAGQPGGSFMINEFGQVLCPVAGSRDKYLVGEVEGALSFEDPEEDIKWLTLAGNGYKFGQNWTKPYLGIKYQLHRNDFIYFWKEGDEGGIIEEPPTQDEDMIENLREIRPNGPLSFVVNHHGVVVAKQETGRKSWTPVYVGKINYKKWFKKEV